MHLKFYSGDTIMATTTTTKKWVSKLKFEARFIHRDKLVKGHPKRKFTAPHGAAPSPITLPIDWTNNAAVSCPMYGNDQYGDCMYAMACHTDNVWTYGLGKAGWTESAFDQAAIIKNYLHLSGGDNGLEEGTLVPAWMNDGLADNVDAKIIDSLDIDITDAAL